LFLSHQRHNKQTNKHVALKRPGPLLSNDVSPACLTYSSSRLTHRSSSALNETARKASKSKNTKGNPVKLPSKVLALAADPHDEDAVYIAEAAGNVKRIKLEVGQLSMEPVRRPFRQAWTLFAHYY
jgi:hypothetical protein